MYDVTNPFAWELVPTRSGPGFHTRHGFTAVSTSKGPRLLGPDGLLHLPPIAGGAPTAVEEARHTSENAWSEYTTEMAKYSDDSLPNDEQTKHLDELRTKATSATKAMHSAEDFLRNKSELDARELERRGRNGGAARNDPAQRLGADLIAPARVSLGQKLVEFDEFNKWLADFAPQGRFPDRSTVNSPPMHFKGFRDLDLRSELLHESGPAQGGALIIPDQYAPITEFGRRPLRIRQLITQLQTTSDSVEFVRITQETSNAATVPEATATDAETSGAVSGQKPESGMEFERVNTPVRTIAHWMPATTRVLTDAPQLRGLIDSFLRYYLDLALEDQIVTGNGIGDNFDGILSTDNVQQIGFDSGDDATGAFFRTARIAKRKILTVGRRIPTAFVLNPEDWERIDLAEDDVRRFYSTGPFEAMQPRLWGLPVVESEAVPVGTGLVGDWGTCVLWDREQSSISISNSHLDFFTRNLVAILCELRAAFGILKPNAMAAFETVSPS